MPADYIIFMADVVDSRHKDQRAVADQLKQLTEAVNDDCRELISSPMTVTLGDEYQGVCTSVDAAVAMILYKESWLLKSRAEFDLRYIVYEGAIDTPINANTSYGMLGPGLTEARSKLVSKSKLRKNVDFSLNDEKKAVLLNYLFKIVTGFRDIPARQRYPEILNQFIFEDLTNIEIARSTGKSTSQIWKFRKNWQVDIWQSGIKVLEEKLYA
jgi:hypothetical protein